MTFTLVVSGEQIPINALLVQHEHKIQRIIMSIRVTCSGTSTAMQDLNCFRSNDDVGHFVCYLGQQHIYRSL